MSVAINTDENSRDMSSKYRHKCDGTNSSNVRCHNGHFFTVLHFIQFVEIVEYFNPLRLLLLHADERPADA
jgi:hypothetical protein